MKQLLLGTFCALLISIGQVFWKIALTKTNFSFSSDVTIKKIINLLLSPFMAWGIIIYIFATMLWMFLLSKYEYSTIYPILASVYVFALVFAHFIFNENIGWNKILGVSLIMFGVFFITRDL